ncbi:cobalt transporter [Methylobacterium sp. Leaf469]|jgi:cobalt transporter subunit CbtA|uniref:CbtA family protein n=1 Tax=unclassified Methylobacterium TaxID=2615210 RepID=UPI00070137A0|nr:MULTISPECIES: CbtA family protein [unclassified Methylobacterium]KQO72986.1 cobalt transporter [Methylobacterium sp. Leaf87]KQP66063.1 cobalt transporter [Methylobacterium sp. Leaf112]KQT99108.1 cobalt transporter [Methylobacterium sp. Leaf469]USU30294.1 CbtA family protein [Methylobacterium sp. OTU13CASTA1]
MIIRLVSAALVAGFLAAIVATGLQLALTSPLIIAAERYETQAQAPVSPPAPGFASLVVRVHGGHDHGAKDPGVSGGETAPAWQPGPGLPRMAFTALATLVGGVGYALLLGAVLLACGREPTPETGLRFAVAGFLAVALAPALGLPPELPGMDAAPLADRQFWWVMTAVATAMGLYLIAIRRAPISIAGGLVLIVAPHLAGAPETSHAASALPAGYAAQFAARSLGIAFVFWAVIGLAYGWAWALFGRKATAHA